MTKNTDLEFLTSMYPAKMSQAKLNYGEYLEKVMGDVKVYVQKRDSLVFQRSQEDLFIFGFYEEACIVSRVVLEDALERKYTRNSYERLKDFIDRVLDGQTKELAHKIRENGNVYAHEKWKELDPGNLNTRELAREKAMKSAKALNQVLVNLGYKEPELFKTYE